MKEPWRASAESLRKVLAQNGWKEQWPSSRMENAPEHHDKAVLSATWWNRGPKALLLVEHKEDGHTFAYVYREVTGKTPIAALIAKRKQ